MSWNRSAPANKFSRRAHRLSPDQWGDPAVVHRRAPAAGAGEHSPVLEHQRATASPRPIRKMFQGAVLRPCTHIRLIATILK